MLLSSSSRRLSAAAAAATGGGGGGSWKPVDLIRRHLREGFLPQTLLHDSQLLKCKLHDWIDVVECQPMSTKATFPATLIVQLEYTCTSSSSSSSSVIQRHRHSRCEDGSVDGAPPPLIHTYRMPMNLWLAVLPWEVQRGLSHCHLTKEEEEEEKGEEKVERCATARADEMHKNHTDNNNNNNTTLGNEGKNEGGVGGEVNEHDDNDDSLGVVYSKVSKQKKEEITLDSDTSESTCGVLPLPPLPSPTFSSSSSSSSSSTPGMLFLLDVPSVRQQDGYVRFWSGAIPHPLDILFFRPCAVTHLPRRPLPLAVAGRAHRGVSPERRSDVELYHRLSVPPDHMDAPTASGYVSSLVQSTSRRRLQWGEGDLSPQVAEMFFPAGDLDLGISSDRSSAIMVLGLHHASYLTPFLSGQQSSGEGSHAQPPPRLEACTRGVTPPYPHYVLECPMGTLEKAIQSAIANAIPLWRRERKRMARGEDKEEEEEGGGEGKGIVEVSVRLELSSALEQEMVSRARMRVSYVEALERAIEQQLRESNKVMPSSSPSPSPSSASLLPLSSSDARDEKIPALEEDVPPVVCPPPPLVKSASASPAALRLPGEAEGAPDTLLPAYLGKLYRPTRDELRERSPRSRSRYPMTGVNVPQTPPLDYPLVAAAFRLGLGLTHVQRYAYERMLSEWRKELVRLRRQRSERGMETNRILTSSGSALSDEDVQCLYALVHAPSLQFPEELGAIVEVVAALRQKEGGGGIIGSK